MKRSFWVFIFILILFLLSYSSAFAQVQTRLRILEASNVGTGIDNSLRDMRDQFGSLFSFTSYRLLKEEGLILYPNKPVSVPIHPGRSIELTLIGQHRNVADVKVKIRREQTDILNTQVRLTPERTVSIGGPRHGQGVIIINLSANF